jgi:hypothetical protein
MRSGLQLQGVLRCSLMTLITCAKVRLLVHKSCELLRCMVTWCASNVRAYKAFVWAHACVAYQIMLHVYNAAAMRCKDPHHQNELP